LDLVWPVLIVAALTGWGLAGSWALRRLAGVGLCAPQEVLPLGVALVLAISGLAVALDAFTAPIVGLIVAAGVACALVELGRWALRGRAPVRGRVLALGFGALVFAAVLLLARWETASFPWNPCDDDVSYLYLVRRLLLHGDLLDPLNNRRLTSLGGMSALQALFLLRLPDTFLPVADLLVGSLLILGGLWRTRSGGWSGWGIAAALTVIVCHASLGVENTSPVLLPAGLTIAAFLFAVRLRAEAIAPRAELAVACVLGLLVGAAATLRPQHALPLGLMAFAAVSWPPLGAGTGYRLAGLAAGAGAAAAGWAVASWRGAATPAFPIFAGNIDPSWPVNGPSVGVPSPSALAGRVIDTLNSGLWSVGLLGATCLATYLVMRSDADRTRARWGLRMHAAAVLSCLVSMAVLAYVWWSLGPLGRHPRFWAPVVLACVLLPIVLLNSGHVRRGWLTTAGGLTVLVLSGTMAGAAPGLVAGSVLGAATDTFSGRVSGVLDADRYATQRDDYAMAAAMVPPGSRVLAAVDVPSLLLSGGSEVDTIDLVGSTSPPPHLRYFEGSDAKLRWLRARGYRYVIAVDPSASACLYNRLRQEEDLRGAQGQPYQAWAPYYLDWFRFLDDVSSSRDSVRVGSLILVTL